MSPNIQGQEIALTDFKRPPSPPPKIWFKQKKSVSFRKLLVVWLTVTLVINIFGIRTITPPPFPPRGKLPPGQGWGFGESQD